MPAGSVNGYPFTAVVGMDDAKRALECALMNPNIHAVLLRGSEGSAKTVLSRAAAGLTDRKIINCPLNVTDEQLFGGLDIEEALKTGRSKLQPGLLSRAHDNILYIDDVNLMDRGMLAGILDAVLTGRVHVERGPISDEYVCNTTLIATMNPDDSDLSGHVLDRFDLVAYAPPRDEEQRNLILARNDVYTSDPEGFVRLFEGEEAGERLKIDKAIKILPLVSISDELISVISELCIKVATDGVRGDLAMVNCAKSLAALNGRDEVMKKDVEEAAVLCLPHRRNYQQEPPEPPEPPEEPPEPPEPEENEDQEPPEPPEDEDNDDDNDDDDQQELPPPPDLPDLEEMMFEIGRQFRVIDYLDSNERLPSRTKTRKGRRTMAQSADGTGRYARSRIPQGKTSDVAFDATIRAAAPYQRVRKSDNLSIVIESRDIREKVRERRSGATIMFLVDASGSLGVRKRMATVKGAILSMLRDSYVKRDRVGLMAFRRDGAEVILPPTKSVEYSYNRLEELPTGGKTPLGEALVRVDEYMTSYSRCHIGERCYIVLVTDGRANVPLTAGADANEEVQKMAEDLSIPNVKWIVVDASSGFPHFDNAERLAQKLGARYFKLENLDADRFAQGVKAALD
ncbi:MAG: VWA domain-containing protein [Candidatus Methanomethylophilaceae archaeon]|nr:VWA domain-containing protein [Candidatus Methanomethylophilaceae archaeon]